MTRNSLAAGALDALRHTVATGCRILGHQGLCEDVLGHISVRVDERRALVRCRGPHERGLLFTRSEDVRLVDLESGTTEDDRWSAPNELPIHAAVLQARADVVAVVHAHPPAVVAADLAGIPLVPMFGAYNIPAAKLADRGIAVYPRAVLIRRADLAAEMVQAMGESDACVLRGHGITTAGGSVQQAVARALAVNSLAVMAGRVRALGARPTSVPAADLAELPDLGADFNDHLIWSHHEARLDHAGLAVPTDDEEGRNGDGRI